MLLLQSEVLTAVLVEWHLWELSEDVAPIQERSLVSKYFLSPLFIDGPAFMGKQMKVRNASSYLFSAALTSLFLLLFCFKIELLPNVHRSFTFSDSLKKKKNNPNTHAQVNRKANCGVSMQWNSTHNEKD